MKRFLILAALSFALLSGCSGVGAARNSDTPAAPETEPSSAGTESSQSIPPPLPSGGFESSLWGDTMAAVMEQESSNSWQLVEVDSSFAALQANAYFQFNEEGALYAGFYRLDTIGEYSGVSNYKTALAYLTQLYGEPSSDTVRSSATGETVAAPTLEEVEKNGGWAFSSWPKAEENLSVTLELQESGIVQATFINLSLAVDS